MERILQYLDDLDDLYGVVGLVWERMRRILINIVVTALVAGAASAGAGLAMLHPPIALATSTMLFVILLYRSVTAPSTRWAHAG